MHSFNRQLLIVQLQTQILLAAAGLKEYEADWLKNANTVVRDASGKFASKATSVAQQTKDKVEGALNETQAKVTSFKQAAENIAKDPKEAKRRVNSKLLDLTGRGLDKLIEKNPEFADQLTSKMFGVDAQKARDMVAHMYTEVSPDLVKEIKKDPFQEVVGNAKAGKLKKKDLLAAFEYAGNKYNKMIDDLNHLEGQPDHIKALGKVAATSIPIATFLAATLAPEVAIGLLLGDSLEVILASAAVGQAASAGANKAMDKMDVKNPLVRTGIDVAIGLGAGLSVSKAAKTLERRAASKAEAVQLKKIENAASKARTEAEKYAIELHPNLKINELEDTAKEITEKFPDIEFETQWNSEDLFLKELNKKGFDGLPDVVSSKELDEFVMQGEIELFRGLKSIKELDASKMLVQFQEGDFFVGKGVYGNGTYTAYGTKGPESIAKSYGDVVMRMAIKKDAKIIDYHELESLIRELDDKITDDSIRKSISHFRDPGRFATFLGYDAISLKNPLILPIVPGNDVNYMIVLNRGAIRVQKEALK